MQPRRYLAVHFVVIMIIFDRSVEGSLEKCVESHKYNSKRQFTLTFLIGSKINSDFNIAHLSFTTVNELFEKEDKEWIETVIEHGYLLRRFLPGGIGNVGILWVCNENIGSERQRILLRLFDKIVKEARNDFITTDNIYCVVHLEAPNYKPQGYTLDAAVKNTDPSPVKVVFSNLEWIGVKSSISINFSLPVRDDVHNFRDQFKYIMSKWNDKEKRHRSSNFVEIQLFLSSDDDFEDFDHKDLIGYSIVDLKANLSIQAAVPSKATMEYAINAVKEHIIRNLSFRAELHYETMEVTDDSDAEDGISIHQFPRLVTAQFPSQSAILLSDCLMQEDTKKIAQDDFKQFFSLEFTEDEISDSYERPLSCKDFYGILEENDKPKRFDRPSSTTSSGVSISSVVPITNIFLDFGLPVVVFYGRDI
ncbi:unnamed protein product [Dracunculus medinensis]|uniref:Protein odr-4 homolog n=1 Tax=Dracunculus medinensis TaxID=318479 RepID=A0A158Q575_DRAME|nr:unnamed protein product [Dracunculus medinensis]